MLLRMPNTQPANEVIASVNAGMTLWNAASATNDTVQCGADPTS